MNLRDADRLARALREVSVRYARNSEGMAIAQMVHSCHDSVPNVPWESIHPYWLAAEKDGELIGCVQVCYSAPIGRLEFLSFAPGLPYRTRALAVKSLLMLGTLTLTKVGSRAVAGCVGFDQKGFKEILKGEGCKVVMSANVLVRTIQ